MAPLIEVRTLSKAFGGVQALDGVSLEIAAGEVHALVGENGAGKSTLIKTLSGVCEPDGGEVLVAGQALVTGNVAASEAAGIAVIHQEPTVFPHLSAEDNIFIGREPRRCAGLLLDRPRMRRETRQLLDRLGEQFDPCRPVGELPVAQRQMVAIARAISRQCRLLIMDEPTASLSARETAVLFEMIRRLSAEGVGILYVSHRMEEIFDLASRVTVLRDGRHVATLPIGEVTTESLIQMMVGRKVAELAERSSRQDQAAPKRLEVRGLTREGVFENISFSVAEGEIVGLAGLVGAGRSEVAQSIFGIDAPDRGSVEIEGKPLPAGSVKAAMAHGLALVPEDRHHLGLVLPMSVGANLTLTVMGSLTRWGLRSSRMEDKLVRRLMEELAVRAAGPSVAAETLSGGNQQKLVLGKWLAAEPRVMILDEPTRGIDVGAKTEIHRLIRRLAGDGMATLLISSDLPELLAISDRILVMRAGVIVGELTRGEATQEKVLALALPGAEPAELSPAMAPQEVS